MKLIEQATKAIKAIKQWAFKHKTGKPFILEYTTTRENQTVRLPLKKNGKYKFAVDWGDGRQCELEEYNRRQQRHTYKKVGTYAVQLKGKIEGLHFQNLSRHKVLVKITQWGLASFGKDGKYVFHLAKNITLAAEDTPDLSQTETLAYSFTSSQIVFAQGIQHWDVSNVEDMTGVFCGCDEFNQPLEKWDVSSVKNMYGMFAFCHNFNQPLEKWDVSNVKYMFGMFRDCHRFNQPLEKWDVSNVKSMAMMFSHCYEFNQPLEKWNVSSVKNMFSMFRDCLDFNQPLEKWDVSNVKGMTMMFAHCHEFNQPLEKWDVSNVKSMKRMFAYCRDFNQPLEKWNTRNVKNMWEVFSRCRCYHHLPPAWCQRWEAKEKAKLESKQKSELAR